MLLTVDLERLRVRPGERLLDAGCGEGRHCFGALERGARVVGIDLRDAEIEAALITHPAVADAAVFGIPNEEFGEEVKAAIELADGHAAGEALAEVLRVHCREHLAGYKVPRSVDFELVLPRHPTGKLYKRLLRDRYWEGRGSRI